MLNLYIINIIKGKDINTKLPSNILNTINYIFATLIINAIYLAINNISIAKRRKLIKDINNIIFNFNRKANRCPKGFITIKALDNISSIIIAESIYIYAINLRKAKAFKMVIKQ